MLKKSIIAIVAGAALALSSASVVQAGHGCRGPGYGYGHGGYHAAYYGGYGGYGGGYYGPGYGYSRTSVGYYGPGVVYRSYRPYYGPAYGYGYYPGGSGVSLSIGF
ncbi:MAG: hypothetical protein KDA44_14555 [Planctomycetales bacterium]|nr:hypothetical protein [Planctomycetales bacterium]